MADTATNNPVFRDKGFSSGADSGVSGSIRAIQNLSAVQRNETCDAVRILPNRPLMLEAGFKKERRPFGRLVFRL